MWIWQLVHRQFQMTRWIPRYLFLITPLCSLLTIAWSASAVLRITGREWINNGFLVFIYFFTPLEESHQVSNICNFSFVARLQCEPSNLNSTIWSTCPSMQCQDSNQLYIGNTISSSTCNQTTCAYSGYTNQTILTKLVAQSTCSSKCTLLGFFNENCHYIMHLFSELVTKFMGHCLHECIRQIHEVGPSKIGKIHE